MGRSSLIAEYPCNGAGVHTLDANDIILLQVILQRALIAEIAPPGREMPHHKSGTPGPVGFVVLMIHAVIADERIAHDDSLSGIGRIGENLLIAGHGGVENHFAHAVVRRSDGLAFKHGAVAKNQSRFHPNTPTLKCFPLF